MDKGKKPMDPVLSEEERRMLETMREFEIITREYLAVMERLSKWLEDPKGDVACAVALQASVTELSDTMRRFMRELDLDDDDDDDEEEEEASTSGSSGLTDLEPEAPPADQPNPDDECSSSSPEFE